MKFGIKNLTLNLSNTKRFYNPRFLFSIKKEIESLKKEG